MISGKGSEEEKNVLSKFTILHGGINEKFIPVLTEQCKKEIEGSFKITNDRELQAMALASPDTLQLEENDELLLKIKKNGGADVQKLVSTLQKACGDNEQEQPDQVIEDLIRESFATMIHFQDLFNDVKNMLSFLEENEEEVETDQIPQKLVKAWTAATKLRVWKTEKIEESERKLQN